MASETSLPDMLASAKSSLARHDTQAAKRLLQSMIVQVLHLQRLHSKQRTPPPSFPPSFHTGINPTPPHDFPDPSPAHPSPPAPAPPLNLPQFNALALFHLGQALYQEGEDWDQAAYCFLLASKPWPPLANVAREHFRALFPETSAFFSREMRDLGVDGSQRLTALFWDTERHWQLARAMTRSLMGRRGGEGGTAGGGGGGGRPCVVVLGPSACILAILLARQVRPANRWFEFSKILIF